MFFFFCSFFLTVFTSINNLGDPYRSSNYGVHSRAFELAVIEYFANLWKIDPNDAWGYVTCSGTEGNLHAMYVARECLPGAPVYFSVETHYSIAKACGFYRMEPCPIATLATGEMDIDAFRTQLIKNKELGHFTAIVNVNCGTTVKGGIDNLARVVKVLDEVIVHREQYHIHVDGALFAQILPHLPGATGVVPVHDFTFPVASISVSGHKMMGCPMPCGVIIHRRANIKKIEKHIAYLNSYDTTIMGSRNGQACLFMWLSIQKKGTKGFESDASLCIKRAKFLYEKLRTAGVKSQLNEFSNTVVLERPTDNAFIQRWQLACTGDIAHVVCMPSSSEQKLQEFFDEYMQTRANDRLLRQHEEAQKTILQLKAETEALKKELEEAKKKA